MANLDRIIDYTKLYQDVELASAISTLKRDPAQLQLFIQNQQNNVYNNIVKQKNDTFEKVYGDLNRATKAQESILMHNKRSKELADLQQQIYDNQENSALALLEDKNMAGRKNEMNEWSVNNKYDTLFVLSSLFIMLSGLLLLTVLWRLGFISSYLWTAFAIPLILIVVLIIIRRSQYTRVLRNKRYWNKQIFEGKYGKIPLPICPEMIQGIQSGIASIEQGVQSGIVGAAQGVASAGQVIASGAQQISVAAQNVS
jgi:signal transduction histidine kinase